MVERQPAVSDAERAEALKEINEFCASGDEVSWEEAVNILCRHRNTIRTALGCMADGKEKGDKP